MKCLVSVVCGHVVSLQPSKRVAIPASKRSRALARSPGLDWSSLTMGDEAAKVAADDAVPGRAFALVKLFDHKLTVEEDKSVAGELAAWDRETDCALNMLGNILLTTCELYDAFISEPFSARTFSMVNLDMASWAIIRCIFVSSPYPYECPMARLILDLPTSMVSCCISSVFV